MKVDGMGNVENLYEKSFEVTSEWCLAINNIDYVCQSIRPFTEELQVEEILQQLSEISCQLEADRCRETLNNVLENSLDTVRNKIAELLETVASKVIIFCTI